MSSYSLAFAEHKKCTYSLISPSSSPEHIKDSSILQGCTDLNKSIPFYFIYYIFYFIIQFIILIEAAPLWCWPKYVQQNPSLRETPPSTSLRTKIRWGGGRGEGTHHAFVGQENTILKCGTFKYLEFQKFEYRISLLTQRMPSEDILLEKHHQASCHEPHTLYDHFQVPFSARSFSPLPPSSGDFDEESFLSPGRLFVSQTRLNVTYQNLKNINKHWNLGNDNLGLLKCIKLWM